MFVRANADNTCVSWLRKKDQEHLITFAAAHNDVFLNFATSRTPGALVDRPVYKRSFY
jgi:hypothetical protein